MFSETRCFFRPACTQLQCSYTTTHNAARHTAQNSVAFHHTGTSAQRGIMVKVFGTSEHIVADQSPLLSLRYSAGPPRRALCPLRSGPAGNSLLRHSAVRRLFTRQTPCRMTDFRLQQTSVPGCADGRDPIGVHLHRCRHSAPLKQTAHP